MAPGRLLHRQLASFAEEIDTVLRFQEETDHSRMLDLACGTGVFARPMARTAEWLSASISPGPCFDRAQVHWPDQERTANLAFIRGTVFKLPFIAGAFPLINCCGALHLFDQPDAALGEMGAGSAPGRTPVDPDHDPARPFGGIAYFLERFIRFGFFKQDELKQRMRRNGFEIVRSERHRISFTLLARKIA